MSLDFQDNQADKKTIVLQANKTSQVKQSFKDKIFFEKAKKEKKRKWQREKRKKKTRVRLRLRPMSQDSIQLQIRKLTKINKAS